jgi:hypothetical protein
MPHKDPAKRKIYAAEWYKKHYAENSAKLAALYRANKGYYKARSQQWRSENHKQMLATLREYRRDNYERIMIIAARRRAKERGVAFDLDEADIFIPFECPVLGIPLLPSSNGKWSPGSPSLDRVKPELGYVKNNVRIISWRANQLKRDATLEELERIVEYMKGKR